MLKKINYYKRAIILRKKGYSYTEILKLVPVGGGTISRWCRDIILNKQQKERIIQKKRDTILIKTLIEGARISKQNALVWAKEKIKEIDFDKKEKILLISGILLYWAEGNKYYDNGHKEIGFTNTDPRLIKIMIRFFEKIAKIPKGKIKIVVRIGREGNVVEAVNYWLNITKIPITNFNKPELITLPVKSKSLIRYPYGMCRIVINNISLSRQISYIMPEFYKGLKIGKIIVN